MTVQIIAFGTPEHDEAVRLRTAILREPLGLEFTEEQLAAEWAQVHFAAYSDQGELLGVMLLAEAEGEAGVAKMRQVAVRADQQGKGVGKQMVAFFEAYCRQNGWNRIALHARQTAVPFYLGLGYQTEGELFEEVGIPHYRMAKALSPKIFV